MTTALLAWLVCPGCGRFVTFTYHEGVSSEPHGEWHEEGWYEYSECRRRFGVDELESAQP
jgi:hypothetical protein